MGLIEKVTMEQDEREEMHGCPGNAGTAFQGEGTHCKDPEADVFKEQREAGVERGRGRQQMRGLRGRGRGLSWNRTVRCRVATVRPLRETGVTGGFQTGH